MSLEQDWGAVAKKDNMNVLATELQKLEETVKQIHQEMQYLRRREEEMRDINGETGACRAMRFLMFTASEICRPVSSELTPRAVVCFTEATSTRVAWFSIGSLVICCVLAAWQLWYLKNFFVRKKLL